jgi:hypothetical protein
MLTPLQTDLIKLVVDKLIIGLILVGFGLFVSRKLEQFKSRQGLELSINNRRVQALGEVVAAVADYEFTLNRVAQLGTEAVSLSPEHYRRKIRECRSEIEMTALLQQMRDELTASGDRDSCLGRISDQLLELIMQSRAKHATADAAINANRFWIGRRFYLQIYDQVRTWPKFLTCIRDGNSTEADRLYREATAKLMDVTSFMQDEPRMRYRPLN